jgi:hypothetical protein
MCAAALEIDMRLLMLMLLGEVCYRLEVGDG